MKSWQMHQKPPEDLLIQIIENRIEFHQKQIDKLEDQILELEKERDEMVEGSNSEQVTFVKVEQGVSIGEVEKVDLK